MEWRRLFLPPVRGLCAAIALGLLPLPANALCPANLATVIEPQLQHPQWQAGQWGIDVRNLSTGEVLYSYQAEKLFLVASNVKLTTTLAALSHWGAQHRFQTVISAVGRSPALERLRIQGGFDPSLRDHDLARMARRLAAQGIQRIQTLEIGGAAPVWTEPTWAIEDLSMGYGATVTRLSVNQNALEIDATPQQIGQPLALAWRQPSATLGWQVVNETRTVATTEPEFLESEVTNRQITIRGQLHVGSPAGDIRVPLPHPASYIQAQIEQALQAAGITVERSVFVDSPDHLPQILLRHASPPLAELMVPINQESDNFYAEMLYVALEQAQPGYRQRYLEGHRIGTAVLVDGSGLSRQNWLTPRALTTLLEAVSRRPEFPLWRRSLPLAGTSGTLRRRFQNTPGRVWAKTGTLRGVVALSGYAEPTRHPPLVFSIVLNQAGTSTAELRRGLDAIVLQLLELTECKT
ncbi:D-alanyl-D-alanine carboxypeptidase/D-alanyl-D-alanine-endopeptidase [Thermosynechococcaceae cyanobacterium Okahandja]